MDYLSDWAVEIGLTGFLDIALMTLLIYGLLLWFQRTRRAGLVLWGILILGGVYLGAVRLGLYLTTFVLRAFFAIFVVMMVVIFQEELRQLFEQIARWSLNRAWLRRHRGPARLPRPEVETLVRTLGDLAEQRTGALVVIAGSDPLARHLDGGVEVRGRLSEALLKSIFDPHSLGHDGAVIVEGGNIEKLGVHLPLSKDTESLGPRGTRHAAALGLAERTDALCLVVSEERGTVSVAQRGRLEVLSGAARLREMIEAFYERQAPRIQARPWQDFFLRNSWVKLAALALAVVLWFGLAYRSELVPQYFTVTVQPRSGPAGLTVVRVSPAALDVLLAAPRQVLRRLQPGDLALHLNLTNATAGFQVVGISGEQFTLPEGVELRDFRPRQVFVETRGTSGASEP